jgi:hypothetical protein
MLQASSIKIPKTLLLRNSDFDNDKSLMDRKIKKGTMAEYQINGRRHERTKFS